MLFNSYEYILVFLPLTVLLFFKVRKLKLLSLLLFSLLFYSYWKFSNIFIILFSIVFNYFLGRIIDVLENENRKRAILIFGIFVNVSFLFYYKYYNFFISNWNHFFTYQIKTVEIILPLAISFFTFQQIAYIVDSYYGKTKNNSFLNYALFVTFFPQLIAGPIVHYSLLIKQFQDIKIQQFYIESFNKGITIFSIGLFKKAILADTFSLWVKDGFDLANSLGFIEAWVVSLCYTFQLYFDFSGYSDMAIGSALLFNIKLPANFNSPYKSINIQDFWRRWHITLSTFLRDYIYIPLGGNRKGVSRTSLNLFLTFFIGGIWHGAGYNFILWGMLHGIGVVINSLFSKFSNFKINKRISWLFTFLFINFAWIFFRAKDWNQLTKVLKGTISFQLFLNEVLDLFSNKDVMNQFFLNTSLGKCPSILLILFSFIIALKFKNSNEIIDQLHLNKFYPIFIGLLFAVSLLFLNRVNEFLYFQF